MTFKSILILTALPLIAGGCVAAKPKAAFADLDQMVAERTGNALHSERGTATNTEVAQLLQTNLTVQSAVTIALLNNRWLAASFEEIGISQADVAQASRLHNIQLAGSWRIPNRPPSIVDTEYSASADFLDLLTMPARKKIAARNLEQKKLEVADKVLQLAADTEAQFYKVQAQMEWVKQLRVVIEADEAAADFAHKQYDAGDINELTMNEQLVAETQAQLEMIRAGAKIKLEHERLNRLLGLRAEEINWSIAGELPQLPENELPLEDLESLAVKQRWDLAARRGAAESFAAALRLKSRTRFVPGVNVGVDTEQTPDGQRVTGPTLELELPLFDQGQPALARIAAQFAQAKDRYAAAELDARSEVREAQAALAAARQAVEFSQKQLLPLRQKILRETLLHYNAMQRNSYELLLAKEQEQMTEQSGVEALRDYWLARVELERAVGGRLTAKSTTKK
jgi:cobalt-zinc-cadmium efflux system outer membrane protein